MVTLLRECANYRFRDSEESEAPGTFKFDSTVHRDTVRSVRNQNLIRHSTCIITPQN